MLTERVSRFVGGAVIGLHFAACSSEKPLEPPSRAVVTANEPTSASANEPTSASASGAAASAGGTNAPPDPRVERLELRPALSPTDRDTLRRSLEQRLNHSVEGLERHTLPDGSQAVNTGDHFQHVVVQVRGEDGKLRTECLENHRQLDALLELRDRR